MIESTAGTQGQRIDSQLLLRRPWRPEADLLSCTDNTLPTFPLCSSAARFFFPPAFIALVDFSLKPVSIVPGQIATKPTHQSAVQTFLQTMEDNPDRTLSGS